MAAPKYKRSWRNLLLNKGYQLRFTLFMVGLSALLMAVLGAWVMKEANEATTVAMARVRGEACPKVPSLAAPAPEEAPPVPMKLDDGSGATAPPTPPPADGSDAEVAPPATIEHDPTFVASMWCAGAGLSCATPEVGKPLVLSGPDCDAVVAGMMQKYDYVEALIGAKVPAVSCDKGKSYPVPKTPPGKARATTGGVQTTSDVVEPEHHAKIQMTESTMTLTPAPIAPPAKLPADFSDRVATYWTCDMRQVGDIESLEAGRMRILWVLIGTGLLLCMGLAVYGLKMTHKVAGPLFKVQLYFAKMREGRFDKVYNLRKGDQLVDFYEHFKSAHAGVVTLEREDIESIRGVIAAAEASGAGDHESIKELRAVLARKEKSLE
jgi:hypothetical protein